MTRGPRRRFNTAWYWLLGVFVLELYFWVLAAEFLAIWWLLWATLAAILNEVAKYRQLPARWGPIMENTRPVWPKRKTPTTDPGW
jgi:hypothetical protein